MKRSAFRAAHNQKVYLSDEVQVALAIDESLGLSIWEISCFQPTRKLLVNGKYIALRDIQTNAT